MSFHKHLAPIKHMTRIDPRDTCHHIEKKNYNHVNSKATYLDDFVNVLPKIECMISSLKVVSSIVQVFSYENIDMILLTIHIF